MSTSPHDTTVGAAINQARTVLYDENGKGIEIAEADAAYWLGKGFTRSPADPEEAHDEFQQVLLVAAQRVNVYVAGCVEDGVIDHGDTANRYAAAQAFVELEGAWRKLNRALEGKYPKLEPEPARLVNMDGAEVNIDPGQVELYLAAGWRLL